MNKLIAAAGIATIGLLGAPQSHAQTKFWSVSATLRGFYDDNYATIPSTPAPGAPKARDSFGIEVSPTIALNFNDNDVTLYGLSYTYNGKYYEDRDSHQMDHSHQVSAFLDHNFSPRYRVKFTDSFVVAQESQLLDPGLSATPLRAEGDNVRNLGTALFSAGLTELLSADVGYQNLLYDYEQDGNGSRSALLDRMEQLFQLNLRWQATPNTVGLIGYQFGMVDQNSSDFLDVTATTKASFRDNRSHYAYLGVDHAFTPDLNGSLRAGGQYTEFPNVPSGSGVDDNAFGPYVDANLTYRYMKDCFAQLGVKHTRIQTDASALDTATTAVYANVSHKITAKLTFNVIGQFQDNTFNETLPFSPAVDDKTDLLFLAGVNLNYAICEHFSAEAGYNYDRLDSDLNNRSFTRNRVYIGVRASY
jgi:hypothetical protein